MCLCLIFQYEPIAPSLRVWLIDRSIFREHDESNCLSHICWTSKVYGTARDVKFELYLVFRYSYKCRFGDLFVCANGSPRGVGKGCLSVRVEVSYLRGGNRRRIDAAKTPQKKRVVRD